MTTIHHRRSFTGLAFALAVLLAPGAWAQEAGEDEPPPPAEEAPDPAAAADQEPEAKPAPQPTGIRIHVVTTRNTYATMAYDVFSVETRRVVASGRGVDEARGERPPVIELPPGTYKIVRAGEPLETKVDFATTILVEGEVLDFVIVVEPDTYHFRGSGPVTMELPEGVTIAGVRLALSAGGTLYFNQKVNAVGATSGITAVVGLFGNFGLVFDRGNHFLSVSAEAQISVTDPPTGSAASTNDRFEASALYAYNLDNPYLGPYLRAGFRTHLFPGYLYLHTEQPQGVVNIRRLDGSTETRMFGTQANPDDLRIRVADPFAPLILQEELGANLKAVSLDLLLVKITAATRLGYGFRQGITNGLLVVDGSEEGTPVNLVEVDDYSTHGPVFGANVNVTVARWLFGSAQLGMMLPVQDAERAGDGVGDRLLIDFSGTAGFKVPVLTSLLFLSFDYTFRLERDGFITNETQFDHTVMARANVTLF